MCHPHDYVKNNIIPKLWPSKYRILRF